MKERAIAQEMYTCQALGEYVVDHLNVQKETVCEIESFYPVLECCLNRVHVTFVHFLF